MWNVPVAGVLALLSSCKWGDADKNWDCFRSAEQLLPINKAPYYAVKGNMMTDGAFGGVEVDANMQAKKQGGGLIDGLFVTGDFASGRHINLGGVKRQVLNDILWAFSSGFIASTNAARCLGAVGI